MEWSEPIHHCKELRVIKPTILINGTFSDNVLEDADIEVAVVLQRSSLADLVLKVLGTYFAFTASVEILESQLNHFRLEDDIFAGSCGDPLGQGQLPFAAKVYHVHELGHLILADTRAVLCKHLVQLLPRQRAAALSIEHFEKLSLLDDLFNRK